MTWTTLLDELLLSGSWQKAPESEFSLYRFSYVSGDLGITGFSRYEVGQFDEDGSGFNLRSYRTESFGHIVLAKKPEFFQSQCLGFRVPAGFNYFVMKVEVNDMPFSNIGAVNSAATTATKTVAYSATEVVIVDPNPERKMIVLQNAANRALYIDFDGNVTITNFAIQIAANQIYEMPVGFSGEIRGIWASGGGGSCKVTEFF